MKIKLLASSLLMAGAMMVSGAASADLIFNNTFANWVARGPILDLDRDMLFTPGSLSGQFDNTSVGDFIHVTITEVELNGVDLYTVAFSFVPGDPLGLFVNAEYESLNGSGDIHYTLTALDPKEWISSARLDTTVHSDTEIITKQLPGTGIISPNWPTGSIDLLCSVHGTDDPQNGEYHFAPLQSINVTDTFTPNGGSIVLVANEFDVVPEPMTLTLMGIGLAAFGARRRFAWLFNQRPYAGLIAG